MLGQGLKFSIDWQMKKIFKNVNQQFDKFCILKCTLKFCIVNVSNI